MLVLKGGTVVSSGGLEKRDLYIDGGKIVSPSPADETVDVSGCLLFPGFIDSHTHLDMPVSGTVTADTFPTGTAAAIAGGTTVILDFATQDRGHTLQEALDVWHRRADGRCFCDYSFHMAVTDWNETTKNELPAMEREGVTSYKAYMAYDALRLNDDDLRALLAATGELGAWLGCHCELGDEVNRNVARCLASGKTGPETHPLSRQNDLESRAIDRFLNLAFEAHGLPWIVHLSTGEGLALIRTARAAGQPVLVETCPQYLTLTEDRYRLPDFEGAKYVCSPPLRSERDRQALLSAVKAGAIDILSTDHCSFNFRGQKELGRNDFSKIPNGLPGIEHRPALLWTLGTPPETMCRTMCEIPAKAFGLWGQKGSLDTGFDADVVVWDPSAASILTAANQEMNCDYSPWEGFALTGGPKAVFLRGQKAAENGKCLRTVSGEYLRRKPAIL